MINPSKIKSAVRGLVGTYQPSDSDYALFDAQSLASDSGYYLNEIPMFKGEYFIDVYCAKDDSQAQINEKFQRLIGDSALSVANRVYDKVDFIDREIFYSHAMNYTKLQNSLQNGFVGYRLQVPIDKDWAFKINRLWIEVDGGGTVDIVLYNTHSFAPIETETVTVNAALKSQEVVLDWVIDNVDFYKGDWYIGYVYDGTLIPYEREYESSNTRNEVRGLKWRSISFPNHITQTLPDLDNEYDLGGEYNGLNLDVTTHVDNTSFVIQNKTMFARAIQLQMAIQVLNGFVASNRSNSEERYAKNLRNSIITLLKGVRGDGLKEQGLETMFISEVSRIKSELDKIKTGVGTSDAIKVDTLN